MNLNSAIRRVASLSLRKKLYFLRIGTGLCMGLFIGLSCFFIATKIYYKNIETDLVDSAHLISAQVQEVIAAEGSVVVQIANSSEVEKYYRSSREALLITLFSKFKKRFEKIEYINSSGTIEVSVGEIDVDLDSEKTDRSTGFLRASENPNTVILGDIVFDEDLLKHAHQLYYHHVDFFDNHLGTIRVTVSLEGLAKHFDALFREDKNRSIIITNDSNKIIYSPQALQLGEAPDEALPDAMKRRDLPFSDKYIGKVHLSNRSFFVAGHDLNDLNWNIFVIKPTKLINQQLLSLLAWILLATFGAILFAEIFSKKIGLRIIEPITKLHEVTSDILKDGDLTKRVAWDSGDELGQLSKSFNYMLEDLDQSQKKLQQERQFIENIMNSMTELLIVVSEKGTIFKINANARIQLDYSEKELLGRPLDYLAPEFTADMDSLFTGTNDISRSFPRINLTKNDGGILPVSLNVSKIVNRGKTSGDYLIIAKDIREELKINAEKASAVEKLREAQEDLLKTEKLAIVGQMSGMVAHEVLNPISAIYTRLDLNLREQKEIAQVNDLLLRLANNWHRELTDNNLAQYLQQKGGKEIVLLKKISESIVKKGIEQTENLEFFTKLIHRVVRTIDNLREMSRHEKSLEKFNLCKLIDEVTYDMSDGLEKRGITVNNNFECSPEFYADYMEMYSIFSNLIKNGMQAIDTNIGSKQKNISIHMWQDNDLIKIQFTDTGVGIDPETEEQLFKTGFSNKGREGTGLGLSYSRKIARESGGDIVLQQSAPGEGASFLVTLSVKASEKRKFNNAQ